MTEILDKGFVEIQELMGDDMSVVNAARVSYMGNSQGEVKDKKLLFYLMEHGHTTPFEMIEFKFIVKCPLFVARQWMRHRTASYNEVSRRYTDQDIEFYYPDMWRFQSKDNKQGGDINLSSFDSGYYSELLRSYCKEGVDRYEAALDTGVSREMARMFLPVNMYTTFIFKMNAHNLMHFLKLRMDLHAQWEIRQYAEAIYNNYFKPNLPWTAEAFELYRLGK